MVLPSNKPKRSMTVSPTMAAFIFIAGIALGHIQAQLSVDTQEYFSSACPVCHHNTDIQGAVTRDNGWHSVDVFYGKSDHLEKMLPQGTEWFSQARQDEAVSTLLRGKRNGYFIDLAANDATILSNTYSLEKKFGWNGLCIEPNPIYWANLTFRDCQVVAAIVGSSRLEEVNFRFNAGDHGGIIGFDNGKHLIRQSEPKYTVTLTEILERFNAPKEIDYLSLDVEGAEEFIMNNFPLDKYRISLMTVERPKDPLKDLLQAHGYQNIKRLSRWGETLWAHESVMKSLYLDTLDDFTPTKNPKPVSS